MAETMFDVDRAHRWFAVEFNNRTWDLLEAAERSAEDTEQMIHLAHAACAHWLAVGSIVNHVRAQCLLATAYAASGLGEAAVRHATKCIELCQAARDEATTFDRATAFGCASLAYACNGDMQSARDAFDRAQQVAAALDPVEDRPVFDKFYPPVR